MPAKLVRHPAPSEMTVISPRPAYHCSLSAKAVVAPNSAGCVPSNAKKWACAASSFAATAMASDRFKRPTAPMPDQGVICSIDSEDDFPCKIALQRQLELSAIFIIKRLMPEPFAFGFSTRLPIAIARCLGIVNFRDR